MKKKKVGGNLTRFHGSWRVWCCRAAVVLFSRRFLFRFVSLHLSFYSIHSVPSHFVSVNPAFVRWPCPTDPPPPPPSYLRQFLCSLTGINGGLDRTFYSQGCVCLSEMTGSRATMRPRHPGASLRRAFALTTIGQKDGRRIVHEYRRKRPMGYTLRGPKHHFCCA